MAIATGKQIGSFGILGLLGSGGMGEVYRAKDTKLGREVAIKVLPPTFAHDSERLGRFRREAHLLASLNHPHIAAIYGLEESGGLHCLVMELVEGETLAQRLHPSRDREGAVGCPLPVEEALEIGRQIAEALEAAHEKNIIHRDLKPANVKVTPEGKVKVLDFGLAKAYVDEPASGDPGDSPTLSAMPTQPGTILGTAAYMSPEQARGKKVDKRTDIWAFGCVLYELLTDKRAFEGEDVSEILASVLKGEPDWNALPAETPPNIRFVLRRCLQKDRDRRLRSAADIAIEMEEALSAPAMPVPAVPTRPAPVWWRALPWAVGVVIAAIASIAAWTVKPAPATAVPAGTRLLVTLGPGERWADLQRFTIALSPDGTRLAYVANRGAVDQMYLRAMDNMQATPLPGTENARTPFFSPDGQWIGFVAGGKLKKISIYGGAAVTLCDAQISSVGATWGDNDVIVFAPAANSGLFQVSAAGGAPQPLTQVDTDNGEYGHIWPQLLPGGKAVLFTITDPGGGVSDKTPIVVQRLDTGERKVLVQGATNGRYLPTGHLLYFNAGTLIAAPFDLQWLEVTGPASPVAEGVMATRGNTTGGAFTFSNTGTLAYLPARPAGEERALVWADRKGVEQPLAAPLRSYNYPRLSPDGRLLAAEVSGDIWVYDIPRGTLSRLTFEGGSARPIWSPDGKRIAFQSARGGVANLFWKSADGSGPDERLTTSENLQATHSWSPDGELIAFTETGSGDIWVLPVKGERKPQVFLQTPFTEGGAKFSPDGRWLAYSSTETGRYEVFVRPFPGPGGKWQISTEGGTEPQWARNGELLYRSGSRMMVVETKTQPTFTAGTPRVLFDGPTYVATGLPTANYDVTADGQRFLVIKGTEQAFAMPIHVVLNWFEELKQKVPVGK